MNGSQHAGFLNAQHRAVLRPVATNKAQEMKSVRSKIATFDGRRQVGLLAAKENRIPKNVVVNIPLTKGIVVNETIKKRRNSNAASLIAEAKKAKTKAALRLPLAVANRAHDAKDLVGTLLVAAHKDTASKSAFSAVLNKAITAAKPETKGPEQKNKLPTKSDTKKTVEPEWDLSRLNKAIETLPYVPPEGVADVDTHDRDPFNCSVYINDIMGYLMTREMEFRLPTDHLLKDHGVTPSMRAILVDWLIQVQKHLRQEQETLHLAVALIDLFLSKQELSVQKLQLLGVTCLLIAAKFVERFPPAIKKLIHLTDNTYKFNDVIRMELKVLQTLKCEVHLPTPSIFVDRYLKVVGDSYDLQKLKQITHYLVDLGLADVKLARYMPSKRAAAAFCLACKVIRSTKSGIKEGAHEDVWSRSLTFHSTYTENELFGCMQRYAKLLRLVKSRYQGAHEKYSDPMYGAISQWTPLKTSYVIQELATAEPYVAEHAARSDAPKMHWNQGRRLDAVA